MEESAQKRTSNKAILAQVNMVMDKQEEFGDDLRHMRDVVIGNGDDSSLLHQVKRLEFGQGTAKEDRERMAGQLVELRGCVTRLERDELESKSVRKSFDDDQKKVLERLGTIETTQAEHGTLIAAFRNRVIGIVSVLSLLAGAGAGFAIAAKLLSTAVP